MGNVLNLKPWPSGVSGNPAGRPKGSRSKLTEAFLAALAEDFDEHGSQAIVDAREKDPMGYIKTIAALCPRELEMKRPLQDLTDDELTSALDALRSFIASAESRGAVGEGTGDEGQPEQAV